MARWYCIAVVLVLVGCDLDIPIQGDGQNATVTRSLAGFTEVRNESSADVVVTQQAAFSVEVTGDSNLLPMVRTTVNGGVLTVSTDEPFSSSIGVSVAVGLPVITGLANAGSGQLSAGSVSSGDLSVEASGSGRVSVQGQTGQLSLTGSGSGGVTLAGMGSGLHASLLGSGATDASAFIASRADVVLSGSGALQLTVRGDAALEDDGSGSIYAALSGGTTSFSVRGSGSIVWSGQTTVGNQVVTGSGTVIQQ
jgi:hypothetical protein